MKESYSNIKLEQYVLNELSADDARKLEHAAEKDDTLKKRIEAIRLSNTEIHTSVDEQEALREIHYRIKNNKIRLDQAENNQKQNKNSPWTRLAYVMPVVAIVAVSTFMIKENVPVTPSAPFDVTEDGVRFKGLQPHLNIYQQTDSGAKLVNNNAILHEGDSLQLSYIAAGQQFGAIFSIDSRNIVTQHFPFDGESSVKLHTSGELMMERSYQLDDAPKYEHFFFITSNSPFDLQKIINLAKNNNVDKQEKIESIDDLPKSINQFLITIKKAEQ